MQNDIKINPILIADTHLMDRINSKLNWEKDELMYLVTAALHNEILLKDNTQDEWYLKLPESIKAICASTKGQILFKQQAASIFCLFTGVTMADAMEWVKNWNKKEPQAREMANILRMGELSLNAIIGRLAAYKKSFFFLAQPIEDVERIIEYLESQKVLTRGGFDVRTLKVGDLTYEYARLVKDNWNGLVQNKTYQRCVVCSVTKAPTCTSVGCWEWEARRLSNNVIVKYSVCKDLRQAAPYLFNHKRWDAENFI